MAAKKPEQPEWEVLKAIIDNFTPEEHAKFTNEIRGTFANTDSRCGRSSKNSCSLTTWTLPKRRRR